MSIELLAQMSPLDFFWGCSILFHGSCCILQFSSVVHKSANFSTSSPKLFFFFFKWKLSQPIWDDISLWFVSCKLFSPHRHEANNNQQPTKGHKRTHLEMADGSSVLAVATVFWKHTYGKAPHTARIKYVHVLYITYASVKLGKAF